MKTVFDISHAILHGDFSNDQLRVIVQAVKYKQDQMNTVARFMFRKGDEVQFKTRDGRVIKGTITKINRKTTEVKSGMTHWKVTSSLLERA